MKPLTSKYRALVYAAALAVVQTFIAVEANGQLLVVDQSNTVGGRVSTGTLVPGQKVGQAFNPTIAGIDWFRFRGSSVGVSTLRLSVAYSYNPLFIPTVISAPLVISNSALDTIEFRFPSTASLIRGSIYTAWLELISGDSYKFEFSNANPYNRGFALNEFGQITPAADMVFSEGIIQVPEPSFLPLLTGGLFLLLAKRGAVTSRS